MDEVFIPCDTPVVHNAIYKLVYDKRMELIRAQKAMEDARTCLTWKDQGYYKYSEELDHQLKVMLQVGILEVMGPFLREYRICRKDKMQRREVQLAAKLFSDVLNGHDK